MGKLLWVDPSTTVADLPIPSLTQGYNLIEQLRVLNTWAQQAVGSDAIVMPRYPENHNGQFDRAEIYMSDTDSLRYVAAMGWGRKHVMHVMGSGLRYCINDPILSKWPENQEFTCRALFTM